MFRARARVQRALAPTAALLFSLRVALKLRRTGIELVEFARATQKLTAADVEKRGARGFLVGSAGEGNLPSTITVFRRDNPFGVPDTDSGRVNGIVVFVLKSRRDDALVRIGRATDNDVIVESPSVSSVHAFVHLEQEQLVLSDGDSKNGTFLDDRPVPRRRDGPAVPLKDGQIVKLGSVSTSFHDAAGLLLRVRAIYPT